MNTPMQKYNVCEEHWENSTTFSDSLDEERKDEDKTIETQGIVKILDRKSTRASNLYHVRQIPENIFLLT